MTISWPGPLHTPVIDPDAYSKKRIAKWIEKNNIALYGSYDGEVDDDDLAEVLFKFEHFLRDEEARRMRE